MSPGAVNINICDYWQPRIIVINIASKETLALNNVLQPFGDIVRNSWVGAPVHILFLTSMFCFALGTCVVPVPISWVPLLSVYLNLLSVASKLIYMFTLFLVLRTLRTLPLVVSVFKDRSLSPVIWSFVRDLIGSPKGHSIDLVALTSNVQTDSFGNPLPVIASFLSSLSIFSSLKLPYTLLVPDVIPRRFRWPLLLLLSTYFSVVCWLLKGQ